MSNNFEQRLFYVVKESDKAYSLYSIRTDHLILSAVTAEVVTDFLLLNEPNSPAFKVLKPDSFLFQKEKNCSTTFSSIFPKDSGFKAYSELSNYHSDSFTYGANYSDSNYSYNPKDLDTTDSPEQLSFDFVYGLNSKKEKIISEILDNPNNVLKAYEDKNTLSARGNNATNSPPELYIVREYSDYPKSKDSDWKNLKWKNLNLDDD